MKHLKLIFYILGSALLIFSCGQLTAPEDIDPPETPANFILIGGGDGQAHFRWVKNHEADFDKYLIYRAVVDTAMFEKIAETRENEYLDRFLSYDFVYYYFIKAVDYVGNESQPTAIIDVRPVNISSPPTVSNLTVFGHNYPNLNQVEFSLKWNPPNVSDIWKFRIFRGEDLEFVATPSTLIDSTAVSIYFDRDVKQGDKFFYRVQCVDLGMKSSLPSVSVGDVILPQPELNSPANQIEFSAPFQFTWKEVQGAVSYQVFIAKAPLSDIIWNSPKTEDKQISYSGSLFRSGQIYYWWVGTYSKEKYISDDNREVLPDINSRSRIRSFFVR